MCSQIIVANKHGEDSKNINDRMFDYSSGSIENTKSKDPSIITILESQGIREHICDILEGSVAAFNNRKDRYNI